jgi:hypothetical protein
VKTPTAAPTVPQRHVVRGEYADTMIVGPADRPDPTPEQREAARKADSVKYTAVLKRFKWSDDDFSFAKSLNFPQPIARTVPGWFGGGSETVYSLQQIDEWAQRLATFAAGLR